MNNTNKQVHKSTASSVIVFIFLIVIAMSANGATTTINSLPYTASLQGNNYSDTLVLAGSHLSSATNGISVTGHDIVIYLGNDTISFGTGNGNSQYGIQFWGDGTNSAHHIKIIGGTIIHNPSDTMVSYNLCVKFAGGSNIYFENTNFIIRGVDAHIMDRPSSAWGMWNIEINGGIWTSEVTAFASRCQYGGAGARLYQALPAVSGNDYHVKIHDITMTTCPGQGIIVEGKSFVYDCNITIDARNDYYTFPSGGVCNSAANSFAIITQKLEPGSYISDNVIRAGTNFQGCDGGILLQMSKGTAADPVLVERNNIEVHRGHDAYYWDMNAKAFKSRYNNKHVLIADNVFRGVVGDTAQSAYGINAMGVDLVVDFDAGCDWAEGRFPDSFLVYENNLIEVVALDRGFESAVAVRLAITNLSGFTWEGAGNVWRNNKIVTPMWGYRIGGYDAIGECHNMVLRGDTVLFADSSWGEHSLYSYYLGFDGNALNNIVYDGTYLDGATDTSIGFLNSNGERTITLKRTLNIKVMGNDGVPVTNASITVTNNYGNTVINSTTDYAGYVIGEVSYWYEAEDSADSTDYSDFVITASKSGDITNINHTVTSTSSDPVITLTNTSGDAEVDTIPPANIDDAEAIQGNHGEVQLIWLASGDDGTTGTADHYDIRYSQEIIDESNWALAELVSQASIPTPSPNGAGVYDSCLVEDLSEGEQYYMALKVFDEADNSAALTIFPISYAGGIVVPLTLTTAVNEADSSASLTCRTVASYYPSISYEFAIDTSASFSNYSIGLSLQMTSDTTAAISNLNSNKQYYWHCRAVSSSPSDSSNWTSIQGFSIANGEIEASFADADMLGPTAGEIFTDSTPVFSVDYVPNLINVYFQIDDTISFTSPTESGAVLATAGEETTWQPEAALDTGIYFWRASADSSVWTTPVSFVISQNVLVFADTDMISPSEGDIFTTSAPSFSVAYITNLTSVYFQIDDTISFTSPTESGAILATSGQVTTWSPEVPLDSGTFYWRASADNSTWTAPVSFNISQGGLVLGDDDLPPPYAYPNPFILSQASYLNFTNMKSGSKLLLVSSVGEMINQLTSAAGEDILWDGTNESGQQIASGIYLWYIENSDYHGKIVVIR